MIKLVKNREPGRALITVANHDSCLDDPVVIAGSLPFRFFRSELCRWSLGAKEVSLFLCLTNFCLNLVYQKKVCHTNKFWSKFFCYGQVIPVIRGNGIYQKAMDFALQELRKGCWLHIFPGKNYNFIFLISTLN